MGVNTRISLTEEGRVLMARSLGHPQQVTSRDLPDNLGALSSELLVAQTVQAAAGVGSHLGKDHCLGPQIAIALLVQELYRRLGDWESLRADIRDSAQATSADGSDS